MAVINSTHDKEFLKNRLAFGGTIGTPGGLNFVAEGYYSRIGLRLEGGAILLLLGIIDGWQTDLSYVLQRDRTSLYEVSAIFRKTYITSVDEPHGTGTSGSGLAITADANGFFVQIGVGHTWSQDYDFHTSTNDKTILNSIPLVFQVGYVH